MKIQEYIDVLRRRGWIILLAAAVTAVSAFVFSRLQTPIYRSSVELSIQLARPDFGLTQSAKQLLRNYAHTMWSEQRAEMVIRELGLFMAPRDLKNDVKIAADDSLLVVKIEVDNPDGELANDIAYTWALLMKQWREEQNDRIDKEDRVFAEIIDRPIYRQLRPRTSINVAAGALLGMVMGTLVLFVLEWLEAGVLHKPTKVESETGLMVIGLIPPVQRSSSSR
ncbi:MAG: YveK family protein [Anaerolineae bacterium]